MALIFQSIFSYFPIWEYSNKKCLLISSTYIFNFYFRLGLIGVLQERRRILGADAPPLLLLAPSQIQSWLHFYDRRIESIRNEYVLINNGDLVRNNLNVFLNFFFN